jgi:ubiquinone/menaquinone biosynthesis C-methylase UbiE
MSITSTFVGPRTKGASEAFDSIASSYDRIFTESSVGKAQRAQITAQIDCTFHAGDRVLELNCGTGEDALALARRGVSVTAYDASPAMIEVANVRVLAGGLPVRASFGVLRNENLDSISGTFDGVLSNFAGMNCSSNWQLIATELERLVRPNGHVLLCIMGRMCLWECFYFLLRGEPRKALRRRSRQHFARVGNTTIAIHYVSVRQAIQAFNSGFTLREWRGVGVFVPPSYCEPSMKTRRSLLQFLAKCDSRLAHAASVTICCLTL